MNEWIMIVVLVWCVLLFPAGGTDIPKIGGQKWLRRLLMSLGLAVLACFYAPLWAGIGYGITIASFLTLGYGSKASWLYRAFIFAGYGAAHLWLGWTWWVVLTPSLCLTIFALSNNKLTAESFPWKICEGAMGFLIAATYIVSILNKWRFV